MGVFFEDGYSLPVLDQPKTHARILHKNLTMRMKLLSASATAATSEDVSVIGDATTYERWSPFANSATDPINMAGTAWTATELTVGVDGQTVAETTANSMHKLSQAVTYTAVEWVVAVKIKRQTTPEFRLVITDGSTQGVFFDLRDGTVGTASAGVTGQIKDLGDDIFLCSMYWTALAATGTLEIRLANGSQVVTYAGAVTNTAQILEVYAHPSEATIDLTPFNTAETADIFAIAAHNLGSRMGNIELQRGAAHTSVMDTSPTDNAPIMGIFEPVATTEWRLVISRAVMPEIGVARIGTAMQIPRPIFGGHTPLDLSRQTTMRSNETASGEWVGRTKLRSTLSTTFEWLNIESAWVRANWPEFQKAAEDEPFFIAWRPETYADAGYCYISQHAAPSPIGIRALMNLSLSVTGFLNAE